ncbi:MAG: AAA family ATPase [Spirochaetales bacterium]
MGQRIELQESLTLIQSLEEGGRLFRAEEQGVKGRRTVLVRMYPAPSLELSRKLLDSDYRSSLALGTPFLLKPLGIRTAGKASCLVLEYFPGLPLTALSKNELLESPEELLYRIGEAIAQVHNQRWAHLGLFPHSVLAYHETQNWKVRLSGFAYAQSEQDNFSEGFQNSIAWEDPKYVSPELSSPDTLLPLSRLPLCDLYSLGALYYFIVEKVKDSIPLTVGDSLKKICSKLLSPDPECRYRSVSGVLRDLELIRELKRLERTEASKTNEIFSPGQTDPPPRIQLGFWGRVTEQAQVREWLQQAEVEGGGCLVEGGAGSGKTTLVKETLKGIDTHSWWVLEGKFSEKTVGGYTGFVSALELFVKKAQLVSSAEYSTLETCLGELPNPVLSFLCSWVPALKALLPKAKTAHFLTFNPVLNLVEHRQVLYTAVASLFEQVSKHWRGIVLFLDDLQWAGEGAIGLCQYLLDLRLPRFFLLFTSRSIPYSFDSQSRLTLYHFT